MLKGIVLLCGAFNSPIVVSTARSPLNEDVFAEPTEERIAVTHEEIKDLQAKIYKLFLQVLQFPNVTFVLLIFDTERLYEVFFFYYFFFLALAAGPQQRLQRLRQFGKQRLS